jgi:hypothetical protein
MTAAQHRALGLAHRAETVAAHPDLPAGRGDQPGEQVKHGRLAGPGRAHHRDELPGAHHQVDATDGPDVEAVRVVDLDQVLGADHRSRRLGRCRV